MAVSLHKVPISCTRSAQPNKNRGIESASKKEYISYFVFGCICQRVERTTNFQASGRDRSVGLVMEHAQDMKVGEARWRGNFVGRRS